MSQALVRVCECWGGAVALLSGLFFACGSVGSLFACCFSNHAWRSLIHRIASVRASVWQLGTTVSLEQRRPVSCRVVLVKTCPICCFLSPFLSVLLTHAVWSAQLSIAVTSHLSYLYYDSCLLFHLASVKLKTTQSCPSFVCCVLFPPCTSKSFLSVITFSFSSSKIIVLKFFFHSTVHLRLVRLLVCAKI